MTTSAIDIITSKVSISRIYLLFFLFLVITVIFIRLTAGTAGVFVKLGDSDLITGAGQFGIVPDDSYFGLSHIYDVPLGYDSTEEDSGLAFGMFP